MSRWAEIYEQLIGRAPTAAQISRTDRIREILRIRDDDSGWYYIVVNEFYVQQINANIKRLERLGQAAKPEEPASKPPLLSELRVMSRRPSTIVAAGIILISLVASSVVMGIVMTTMYGKWDMERSLAAKEQRDTLKVETQRQIDSALAADAKEIREIVVPLIDPRYGALREAYQQLSIEDQQKLAADPTTTIRTLHVMAALTPEAQAAFNASNDPGTEQGTTRQSALAWFSAQVTSGNQNASRLVAAYAADNSAVALLLKKLPSNCSLNSLANCR